MNIYKLLFESDEYADAPEDNVSSSGDAKARPSEDSVDDQIDSLILKYEQNALKSNEATPSSSLSESLQNFNLKFLLEQEDQEVEEEPAEDEESPLPDDTDDETPGEGETMADEPEGSETPDEDVEPAESQVVPNLDIDIFSKKVARLVMNNRNLLRIEDVIINRSKNFLDENYGDAFVTKFIKTLNEQFGLEVSDVSSEMYPDQDAPYAIGANPEGSGLTGGGGGGTP